MTGSIKNPTPCPLPVSRGEGKEKEGEREKAGEIQPREFKTQSGSEIKRVYAPADLQEKNPLPGQYPFTRGLYPEGYRKKLWTMRMYCGYGSPAQTNKRFHYLIRHGETGLSLAFDLPTQIGYDPDDPKCQGEIGKVGVSISGLWDFEKLFKNIDLEKISLSMTINATAFILYAFYLALAKKRGLDLKNLRGTVQNDILKEYIARGTYRYPPEPSLRLASDLILYSLENTPLFYPISVSGYHIREAGATAIDEVAFTFADAFVYLDDLRRLGTNLETVLPRLSFFFGVHNHLLEEVAKFRAARRVWAQAASSRYQITEPRLLRMRFHAQTCGSTLVRQEPLNNACRVSIQAMAAVLGGAQSLHTNSYDEAISLPSPEAQLLALRTQQILAVETGAADVADPLAGSYALENLTDKLAEAVRKRLDEIENMGGMLQAVKSGFAAGAIAEASYRRQMEIESGKAAVVGVNILKEEEAAPAKAFAVAQTMAKESTREVRRQRKKRDQSKVGRALERLGNAASGRDNLIGYTIEAGEAGATLGEIAAAVEKVFGYAK
ncbi:MAG: methylmalonyl-CoA mutase [Elusimicrobia bacterium]|nr:methylmalonyl-CoA mutase [Elusimicrobiota bacterium]